MKIAISIFFGLFITYLYFYSIKKELYLLKRGKKSIFFNFFSRMIAIFIVLSFTFLFIKEYAVISIFIFIVFRFFVIYSFAKKLNRV